MINDGEIRLIKSDRHQTKGHSLMMGRVRVREAGISILGPP